MFLRPWAGDWTVEKPVLTTKVEVLPILKPSKIKHFYYNTPFNALEKLTLKRVSSSPHHQWPRSLAIQELPSMFRLNVRKISEPLHGTVIAALSLAESEERQTVTSSGKKLSYQTTNGFLFQLCGWVFITKTSTQNKNHYFCFYTVNFFALRLIQKSIYLCCVTPPVYECMSLL